MSATKKIVKGTAIAAGSVAAVGGFAVYATARSVKNLVYPPTMKKYIALAALPFALYSIRQPEVVVGKITSYVRNIHAVSLQYLDKMNNEKAESLSQELDAVKKAKSDLEEMLAKSKDTLAPSNHFVEKKSAHRETIKAAAEKYLDNFASSYQSSIFVDAQENKLYLLKSNGRLFSRVAEYPCTTGKNPLPKSREGDFATPQGIFMASIESAPGWSDIYVDEKIRINIPEDMGSGIIITATDDSSTVYAVMNGKDVTNGGVVMSSRDFISLYQKIRGNEKIPVSILVSGEHKLLDYAKGGF